MPKVKDTTAYHKAEVFGRENTGKSVYAYSVCQLLDIKSEKTNIEVFTNESSFAETIKLFPDYEKYFTFRQSRSLDEFISDWAEFCADYKVTTAIDKQTHRLVVDTTTVAKKVFAIIIDEGFYIYDGFITEHYNKYIAKDETNKRMEAKDYGVPRQNFIHQMKNLFMMPCHVIITSKVKDEFEEKPYETRAGKTYKQWVRTGGDIYPLPPMWVYEPAIRLHLFKLDTPQWIDNPENPRQKIAKIDKETRQQEVLSTFKGELIKQKADRSKPFVMEDPTVKKIDKKLKLLALAASKKI